MAEGETAGAHRRKKKISGKPEIGAHFAIFNFPYTPISWRQSSEILRALAVRVGGRLERADFCSNRIRHDCRAMCAPAALGFQNREHAGGRRAHAPRPNRVWPQG